MLQPSLRRRNKNYIFVRNKCSCCVEETFVFDNYYCQGVTPHRQILIGDGSILVGQILSFRCFARFWWQCLTIFGCLTLRILLAKSLLLLMNSRYPLVNKPKDGISPCLMAKSTISVGILHIYFDITSEALSNYLEIQISGDFDDLFFDGNGASRGGRTGRICDWNADATEGWTLTLNRMIASGKLSHNYGKIIGTWWFHCGLRGFYGIYPLAKQVSSVQNLCWLMIRRGKLLVTLW